MLKEISVGAIVFRRETENNSGNKKINPAFLKKAQDKIYSQRLKRCGIKFLILEHYLGHWDFPRGIIEKGEEEKETAKREIFEETGIQDIKFIDEFRETTSWQYKKQTEQTFQDVFKTAILYLAETKTKEIKLSSEHQDYKWLETDEAKEKLTFENSKILLEKAVIFLKR